ncbi:family 20 glycosylhydrolase [Terracidiphilus gabretensis]|uniref:family 20 glycosylhydrolase n=1 Tax=Terracidiphilus gabretensis TaxID=1577687 RepID=UPI00071BAE2E|nr:family 20 glycosylhydrolase [Terracidiphilus gabretensis]
MKNRSRREFLFGASIATTSLAMGSRLLADTGKAAGRGTMRGLMVDAGRVPESVEYYRRVIEFCADWELNALQFRLADDQGSAVHFTSLPDLAAHTDALAPEQLRGLAEYAQSHGVDLIPELESFGHTGYITRSPAYAHLLDNDPQGSSEFTGIIPVHPETLQIFEKLYREVASIFPSKYLHGGCDEVNWGGSPLSRKALQLKTRTQIWAEYLNSLNHIAQGLGKEWIVWGDLVVHKEPEILGLLNKNILIMDWNYSDNSSAQVRETLLKVVANGSRAIGAPALVNYKWGARVGAEQLRNIDAYAQAYLEEDAPGSLGVILTNWVPSRYIQNSIWDGFAYAAVAFQQGTATAQTSGFRRFVEKHYGAGWNESWGEAFESIYAAAPSIKDRETASWMGLHLPVPWSSDEQLAALLKDGTRQPNPFTRLRSLLIELEPLVMKNLGDFQAFALSVEYLERMFWREAVILEHRAEGPQAQEARDLLIKGIADRDQTLAEALSRDWDRGRSPLSRAKTELLPYLEPKDQLVFQWKQAAAYSASLARHPERFYQLMQTAKSEQ